MEKSHGGLPAALGFLASCGKSEENALDAVVYLVLPVVFLLLVAHVLHLFLRRLGQPSAISQMLAGLMLGTSGIGNPKWPLREMLPSMADEEAMSSVANFGRLFFMFLVGLEMDIPYLFRSSRSASIVAGGGALAAAATAAAVSPLVHWLFNLSKSDVTFAAILVGIFANTASPILIRMTTELKLTNSEVGRLAISASLVNDMTCLLGLSALTTVVVQDQNSSGGEKAMRSVGALVILAVSLYVVRPMSRWLNRRNKTRRYLKVSETIMVLAFVTGVSSATEVIGYNSMMTCFLMGLLFPREGSTARTLVDRLTYAVHNLILPVYFGFIGMQVDVSYIHGRYAWGALVIVVMGTLGKVAGTVAATRYLKIPLFEGLVLGFLLNVKGHVDSLIIILAWKHDMLNMPAFMALLMTVLLNTVVVGPAVAAMVRRERKALKYMSMGMEWQPPESELRLLACVHGPRQVPALLNLVDISSGTDRTPIAAYLMQLVELTTKTITTVLYHQQEDQGDGEDDFDADQTRQINVAVDGFTLETGITLRQVTAVSAFANMHEDVCNGAEDVRASLVVLPFHKFLRVDGKMIPGKGGVQAMNAKVLANAPCTVGIFVDRGFGASAAQVTSSSPAPSYQVVALFFGGRDDREAVAYGGRLALHPLVSLTVVRFRPSSDARYAAGMEMEASKDEEVLIAISRHDEERQADEAFLAGFYGRFVVPGTVTYEEKYADNAAGTVEELRAMDGAYSLFLVGRGGRGPSPLVVGMSEWEECPELGPIGDLLASSDFMDRPGSVLVLQQHTVSKQHTHADDPLDEFQVS